MRREDMFPSNWLIAKDIPDEGMVVTIHHVETAKMRDGKEKPVIFFEECEKGLVCNVTNWKTLEKLIGEEDSDDWTDERITLYATETTMDGEMKDCIRVKNRKPKPSVKLANGAKKAPDGGPANKPMTPAEVDDDGEDETPF